VKEGETGALQYLILLRPHQYLKNLFIFAPLFFAGKVTDAVLLGKTVMAFIAFSLTASALYVLNDYKDIKEDREHPIKKYRPVASGAVTKTAALSVMTVLFAAGAGMAFTQGTGLLLTILAYTALNVAYSFALKHVSLLDVFTIAIGFVLRLYAGSVVTDIALSMWIVMMGFLLALFLALAKRRDDLLLSGEGRNVRKSIDGYNIELVNGAMTIMASVILVSYVMYTLTHEIVSKFHTDRLYITSFFVLFGILRYMQITLVEKGSGEPTKVLLRDRLLQLAIVAWLFSFAMLIY
jgi:4-hydroxybenzoate polyprenyltransferase